MKALIEAYWYSPFNLVPQSMSNELVIQIKARKAPLWLLAYVKYVLFKRKVTPKIMGMISLS